MGKGGGGNSGKVDYPEYMKNYHKEYLDNDGLDTFTLSMVDLINAAVGSSPFTGESAYDPTTNVTAITDAVCAFNVAVDALSSSSDWTTAMTSARTEIDTNVINDTYINADIAAFSDLQDDERDTKVIPRFEGGMRSINAVMSSAFVIGEAVIESFGARDVAKYSSGLRAKLNFQRNEMIMSGSAQILKDLMTRIEFEKAVAQITTEAYRIAIVAGKEQVDKDLSIDEQDAQWDLEMMQYGGNALAAIGGGVAGRSSAAASPVASAIGGALSGAAAGTAIAPGIGTVIGAGVGLAASFL